MVGIERLKLAPRLGSGDQPPYRMHPPQLAALHEQITGSIRTNRRKPQRPRGHVARGYFLAARTTALIADRFMSVGFASRLGECVSDGRPLLEAHTEQTSTMIDDIERNLEADRRRI